MLMGAHEVFDKISKRPTIQYCNICQIDGFIDEGSYGCAKQVTSSVSLAANKEELGSLELQCSFA